MANKEIDELRKKNKMLEEELDATKKLLNTLFNSVNDIVYIVDPDSKIVEVNKKVEDYGYKAEELRGRPISEFVPEQHKEAARQLVVERREKFREVEKGERKQFYQVVELPFVDKNNQIRELQAFGGSFTADFKVKTIRIHNGEPIKKNHIYTVGVARDFTKQRELEREKEQLIKNLEISLTELKKLSGLLPICASCKKIKDGGGIWQHLEAYIESNSEAIFTHCICPKCAETLYKDTNWYKKKQLKEKS